MILSLFRPLSAGKVTENLVQRMALAGFTLANSTGFFATFSTSQAYRENTTKLDQMFHLEITLDFEDEWIDALVGVGDDEGPVFARVLGDRDADLVHWLNEIGRPGQDAREMTPHHAVFYEATQEFPEAYRALVDRVSSIDKWMAANLEPQSKTLQ